MSIKSISQKSYLYITLHISQGEAATSKILALRFTARRGMLGECAVQVNGGEEGGSGDGHLWRAPKREFNTPDAGQLQGSLC